jgi:hypothetical protein
MVMGDFNECMWQEEHCSRRRRGERQMHDFREVLSECNLHDLGYNGRPWTYDNKQEGRNNIRVRLDRAVTRPDWYNLFPNNQLVHLTSSRSDHCPILLSLDNTLIMPRNAPTQRYEVYWEREANLSEEINIAWSKHKKPADLADAASNFLERSDGILAFLEQTNHWMYSKTNREEKKEA